MGLTPFHRRSFLALQRTLAGDQIALDLFGEDVVDGLHDDFAAVTIPDDVALVERAAVAGPIPSAGALVAVD
jgi:hypothetical protein